MIIALGGNNNVFVVNRRCHLRPFFPVRPGLSLPESDKRPFIFSQTWPKLSIYGGQSII